MIAFAGLVAAAAVAVLVLVMLYGAASDFARFEIPNWVSIVAALAFLPAALGAGLGLAQIGVAIAVGFGCLVIGIVAFAFGLFGGGDVKLFAAGAVWAGWENLAPYVLVVAIVGGLLSLALLGFRRLPLPARLARVGWLKAQHGGGSAVPYGAAIAAGVILSLSRSPVMVPLLAT